MLTAFHKPYGVLSQFTQEEAHHRTLAEFGFPESVYPLGRLDLDSEGLLLLSDEKGLEHQLLHPSKKHRRVYWAQIEGMIGEEALEKLRRGVAVRDYVTRPAEVRLLEPAPEMWPRDPPVRVRQSVPDCWIELTLREGKNRQVRRMCAAVGFPVLRLIRVRIGDYAPDLRTTLPTGQWLPVTEAERQQIFSPSAGRSAAAAAEKTKSPRPQRRTRRRD